MKKKEIAMRFLETASSGNVGPAFEQYVHRDFIHHNVYFRGDRLTLMTAMVDNAREFPEKNFETVRSLESSGTKPHQFR